MSPFASPEHPAAGPGSKTAAAPAVELDHVAKLIGDRIILDDISLAVNRGEFFALIGPSGSGKSTLLKMVSGIDTPTRGQVRLAGRDVTHVPPYRRPVHTVFQSYALFPHLDVAGNVGFPLRIAGMPRKERQGRILRALGWVRLDQFAHRRIDSLSGGERQRVALARALVDEPECVLLDEPLAALDPHLRGHTLELLQEIQDRLGITYLYVTHDRQEALRAADRIGVLDQGRLQQIGTPEELYHQPASAFVASFIGPINWLHGEITSQNGLPAVRVMGNELIPLETSTRPAGTRVKVGIRPEAITVGATGLLPAQVTQRQFCGSTVVLRLTLADGTTLGAELRGEITPPNLGETTRVLWSPSAMHVFEG